MAELIVNNDSSARWEQLDYTFSLCVIKASNWALKIPMNHCGWFNIMKDADTMYLMGGEI